MKEVWLFLRKVFMINTQTATSEHLYYTAKSFLGIDITPKDEIPDDVACVAQVQEVVRRATGNYIGIGAALYNTRAFKDQSLKDRRMFEVHEDEILPGDICVYPTGEGNGRISNGHVFIIGEHQWMSNSSKTGLWSANYTRQSAKDYYETKGGYTPYFFRLV